MAEQLSRWSRATGCPRNGGGATQERPEACEDLLIEENGFTEDDLVFDCLGLVVSAMQDGSKATLRTIALIKEYFPRSATTLGLEQRQKLWAPQSRVCPQCVLGLCRSTRIGFPPIMSVTEPMGKAFAWLRHSMWSPKMGTIEHFIDQFSEKIEIGSAKAAGVPWRRRGAGAKAAGAREPEWVAKFPALEQGIFRSIVSGEKDTTFKLATEFAKLYPERAMDVFVEVMTPAIRHLGDLFAQRIKFIPHLIAAAEAMKVGVAVLEPLLVKLGPLAVRPRAAWFFCNGERRHS